MLPDELRAARKSLGFTQHRMADALGFGKWGFQTVAAMEKGKAPITERTAKAVLAIVAASERNVS